MIKITLNGKEKEITENTKLLVLLEDLNLSPDSVVVEMNKNIVRKDNFSETFIKENDKLEILRFVGGG